MQEDEWVMSLDNDQENLITWRLQKLEQKMDKVLALLDEKYATKEELKSLQRIIFTVGALVGIAVLRAILATIGLTA